MRALVAVARALRRADHAGARAAPAADRLARHRRGRAARDLPPLGLLHAVHGDLQRERPAGDRAAAVRRRRRAPARRPARRPPGRRGRAARARRRARGARRRRAPRARRSADAEHRGHRARVHAEPARRRCVPSAASIETSISSTSSQVANARWPDQLARAGAARARRPASGCAASAPAAAERAQREPHDLLVGQHVGSGELVARAAACRARARPSRSRRRRQTQIGCELGAPAARERHHAGQQREPARAASGRRSPGA